MKKLYSTIMMLAMMVAALSLTACSSSSDDDGDGGGGSSSSLVLTTSDGTKYYLLEDNGDNDWMGHLTDRSPQTIWCFMEKKNPRNIVYLHVYLEDGGMTMSDFTKGYDLGHPTINFGQSITVTNEFYYVSGSIKVKSSGSSKFVLEFNNYVAEKANGNTITINGTLDVQDGDYF